MEYLKSSPSQSESDKNLLRSASLAEISLKYRVQVPLDEMPCIHSPQDAIELLRSVWDEDKIQLHEEFVVLLLNTRKRCLGWSKISLGGSTSTIVDPATIFQVALLSNATSIILAHNHPSGNIGPSSADKNITQRIKKVGEMLGINVVDHFILTANAYFSFKEENIL